MRRLEQTVFTQKGLRAGSAGITQQPSKRTRGPLSWTLATSRRTSTVGLLTIRYVVVTYFNRGCAYE